MFIRSRTHFVRDQSVLRGAELRHTSGNEIWPRPPDSVFDDVRHEGGQRETCQEAEHRGMHEAVSWMHDKRPYDNGRQRSKTTVDNRPP